MDSFWLSVVFSRHAFLTEVRDMDGSGSGEDKNEKPACTGEKQAKNSIAIKLTFPQSGSI